MKLKDIEGSPEEIHDLFKNTGMDLSKYVSPPMKSRWIVTPATLGLLTLIIVVVGPLVFAEFSKKCLVGVMVVYLSLLVWMTIAVQLKYSNNTGTIVAGLGGFIILLVAAGLLPVSEVLSTIKGLR